MNEPKPPDPYAVLGVEPDATSVEIARAYRRLLRAHHPDTGTATSTDPRILAALLDAYELLRDPVRRAAYDRGRQHRQPVKRSTPPGVRPQPHREPVIRAGPVRWHIR